LVSIVAPPDASEAAERGVGATFFIVEPDRRELATIATLVDRGAIIPIVDRVYPLADARAAYTRLATEHHRGKIVLHVTGDRP
jgi:NADPH:quinone reductase-like Zn-dependent oxidoreductase